MNPDRPFYMREIAKITGEPLNAVRRELGYLEKAGLLKSGRRGNLKYYSVVKEFPLYPELKKIIYATVGLGDYIGSKFTDGGDVDLVFIYGSVARNEETARSDIDLFVMGQIKEDTLHEMVAKAEKEIGRQISYTLMSKNEFDERQKKGEPFLKRVLADRKIIIKGNMDVYQQAS